MKVLGIDPGTNATGYGLVAVRGGGRLLLECGVIRPDGSASLPARLVEIHTGLLELIERLEPDCVAVEGVFHGRNARTAVILGHARGAAVLAAALRGLDVLEYPPAEIKKAVTGSGGATKRQVGFMVQKHLSLREPPRPADAADGCAVALCHLMRGRLPGEATGRGAGLRA